MGCKRVTIFFILTHLRHDWDTGTVAPKVHKRCTRGAREVHERGTRGAREGHERGTRGAGEVHLWALKGTRYFSFWHGWDTVGTRLGHGDIGAIGAQEVHERGTRGAREGHERGTRGAREVHRLTSLRPSTGTHFCENIPKMFKIPPREWFYGHFKVCGQHNKSSIWFVCSTTYYSLLS